MSDIEITIPEFLKETEEQIHKRMLDNAPPDINIMEGDFFWDATRPTAIEIYNLKNILLQYLTKVAMLPTAEGIYLEGIASEYNIYRIPATKAELRISFTAPSGTVLPAGTKVSTISDNDGKYYEYILDKDYTVGVSNSGVVDFKAAEGGTAYNIQSLLYGQQDLVLIPSIRNVTKVNGYLEVKGKDAESDEELRQRLITRIQNPITSGNVAQYKEWCESVEYVGGARIFPLWNGNGTVKCVIYGENGGSLDDNIIEKVTNYIESVRPIGADVTVCSAKEMEINFYGTIYIKEGRTPTEINDEIKTKIKEYLFEVTKSGEKIRINKIANIIMNVKNVVDFKDLKLNDSSSDLTLDDDVVPVFYAEFFKYASDSLL